MAYTAAAAIKAAEKEIGTRETGTNKIKYNDWLGKISGYPHGGYGYPWCASFQSWVADRAGGRANVDYPKTAGCAVAVAWFKSKGRWGTTPRAGDWVFYGPGGETHVELVTEVGAHTIRTIGGNTSGSLSGRYYNGDGVYAKTVSRSSDRIYGYGRPVYEEDDMPTAKDVWKYNIAAPWVKDGGDDQWQADTHIRVMHSHIRNLEALVAGLASKVGADVDEDAIVAGVLAGLTPERIAAAIPQDIGEQVAEALAARLAAGRE